MAPDQTISQKSQYTRWWLLASALIAIGLILIYYISPSIRNERKVAQKRFNEIQHELASVTGDQLVFESNPAGNVIDGDGEKIHKDCFTGEAEQIFQAERVFDAIIEDYSAKLGDNLEPVLVGWWPRGCPEQTTARRPKEAKLQWGCNLGWASTTWIE